MVICSGGVGGVVNVTPNRYEVFGDASDSLDLQQSISLGDCPGLSDRPHGTWISTKLGGRMWTCDLFEFAVL